MSLLSEKTVSFFPPILLMVQKEIHKLARQKGLWNKPIDKLLLEELAKGLKPSKNLPGILVIEEELASMVNDILDVAEYCGLDIGKALVAKHKYNKALPSKEGKDNAR